MKGHKVITPFITDYYYDYYVELTGDKDAIYYYGKEYPMLRIVRNVYEV